MDRLDGVMKALVDTPTGAGGCSMMVLILGGDGMLGYQLWKHFRARYEIRVPSARISEPNAPYGLFDPERTYANTDVLNPDTLHRVFVDFRPGVVINAVGLVKRRPTAILVMEVNAVLPHRLALLCKAVGARLILPSTDCVYSGAKGNYRGDDVSDAKDFCGKAKYLGEVIVS